MRGNQKAVTKGKDCQASEKIKRTMIPSELLRRRIALIKKARDKCVHRWNKTTDEQKKTALQLTTVALANTQFELQAELYLLSNGEANCN